MQRDALRNTVSRILPVSIAAVLILLYNSTVFAGAHTRGKKARCNSRRDSRRYVVSDSR